MAGTTGAAPGTFALPKDNGRTTADWDTNVQDTHKNSTHVQYQATFDQEQLFRLQLSCHSFYGMKLLDVLIYDQQEML